jgi:Ca2+-binding EF-hand superfamily protein
MLAVFKILDFKMDDSSVDELMKQLDTKHPDHVQFEEFKKSMDERFSQPLDHDEIQEVFNHFKPDRNGQVSVENIKAVFKKVGRTFTPVELKRIMDRLDQDKTGQVSLDDFILFLK